MFDNLVKNKNGTTWECTTTGETHDAGMTLFRELGGLLGTLGSCY